MSGYTTEDIYDIFNNHPSDYMVFNDPLTDCTYRLVPDDRGFDITTLKNGTVRQTGRVVWSVPEQAFVGTGYNISMTWRL